MKDLLERGKYVVAVSGGVDSVVLLNMLSMQDNLDLVVAHYDHGIRKDSAEDAQFVEELAKRLNLPYESINGHLGADASEALAREKRYLFLESVNEKYGAQSIVTAHHRDDVLETAIINLLRGTKRKGLSSLRSTSTIKRPLLDMTKKEIIEYANHNKLVWREDPSNENTKYLRNLVRHKLRTADPQVASELLTLINKAEIKNSATDSLLESIAPLSSDQTEISRQWLIAQPHDVTREVLAFWLRIHRVSFDAKQIDKLSTNLKTAKIGSRYDINKTLIFVVEKDLIRMRPRS